MRRLPSLSTVLVLLFAAALLASCGPSEPESGVDLTLTLAGLGGAPVTAADVTATSEVLRARIEPAGWLWHRIEPVDSGLKVRVGAMTDDQEAALVRLLTRPYHLEVHKMPQGEDREVWVPGATEPPILTEAGIEHSFLEAAHAGTRINLQLTTDAGAAVFEATSPDGGTIVVTIDGEKLMASTLQAPIRGAIRLLPEGDDLEQNAAAVELVCGLKAGPLPTVPAVTARATW